MSDIQEEQKRLYKRAEENDRKDTISIQNLFDERNEQNKRIEELVLALESTEQRIDKAIEYIKRHIQPDSFEGYLDSYEIKKTLNILQGDNK